MLQGIRLAECAAIGREYGCPWVRLCQDVIGGWEKYVGAALAEICCTVCSSVSLLLKLMN